MLSTARARGLVKACTKHLETHPAAGTPRPQKKSGGKMPPRPVLKYRGPAYFGAS